MRGSLDGTELGFVPAEATRTSERYAPGQMRKEEKGGEGTDVASLALMSSGNSNLRNLCLSCQSISASNRIRLLASFLSEPAIASSEIVA